MKMNYNVGWGLVMLVFACMLRPIGAHGQADTWAPADNPLMTKWADDVDPENPLPKYPRPKMKRDEWTNLNGVWDFQISDKRHKGKYDDQILVPFP